MWPLVDRDAISGLVDDRNTGKPGAPELVLAGEAFRVDDHEGTVDGLVVEGNQKVVDPDEDGDDAGRAVTDEEARVDLTLRQLALAGGQGDGKVMEESRVGSLPHVPCLLEPLQTFVQQAHRVRLGGTCEITSHFQARHLLDIELDVDGIEREGLGNITLSEEEGKGHAEAQEGTHRASRGSGAVRVTEVINALQEAKPNPPGTTLGDGSRAVRVLELVGVGYLCLDNLLVGRPFNQCEGGILSLGCQVLDVGRTPLICIESIQGFSRGLGRLCFRIVQTVRRRGIVADEDRVVAITGHGNSICAVHSCS
eukprot:246405-Prymnesium_polylepis.1